MAPKLYRAILPVDDMKRADAFWSRLLELEVDPVVPTRHYLHTGGAILALVHPGEHGRKHRPTPEWVYFRVPDLDASYRRAQALACPSVEEEGRGIRVRPWGERSFYTRDPFGNPLCFVDDAQAYEGSASTTKYAGSPIANLCKVILPTTDLEGADAFWSRLLDLAVDTEVANRHFFYCDSCILALVDTVQHDRAHGRTPPRSFAPNPELVYLGVPDLEETYQRALELGCPSPTDDEVGEGIRQRPWGERSFYTLDPSGNPICFVDDQTLFTGSAGS